MNLFSLTVLLVITQNSRDVYPCASPGELETNDRPRDTERLCQLTNSGNHNN
jgi:hypothetical protein